MGKKILLSMVFASLVVFSLGGAGRLSGAEAVSPPSQLDPPGTGAQLHGQAPAYADVNAVLLKSWGNGSASGWGDLNATWPEYGDVSISIDQTTLAGCQSTLTYEDLVASNADVVILGDPAGCGGDFSDSEAAALERYVSEGHNIVGTYHVFRWSTTDNRSLLPLFGLESTLEFGVEKVAISNLFEVVDAESPLLQGMPVPAWNSLGYAYTEVPNDDFRWDEIDLVGAEVVAESDDRAAIVSVVHNPNHSGIFISNMPEFNGGPVDLQLLYNAITYPPGGGCQSRLKVTLSEASIPHVDVWLRHQMPWSLVTPLEYELRDVEGSLVARWDAGPISFEFGDEYLFSGPAPGVGSLAPGEYRLGLRIEGMRGFASLSTRFTVLE